MSHRFTIPEEDFEVAMTAYEWPKKVRVVSGCAGAVVLLRLQPDSPRTLQVLCTDFQAVLPVTTSDCSAPI